MASKPTQRSLKHLRDLGWKVCIVEKFNAFAGVRQDAFGIGDLLACLPWEGPGTAGAIALVQTTSDLGGTFAAHRAKILGELKGKDEKEQARLDEIHQNFLAWKAAGGLVFLHAWKLRPKDGIRGARKVWSLREESL